MLLEVVVGLSDSLQRVKAGPQCQGKPSNPDALPQPFLPSAFYSQPTPYSCRPTKPIPPKGQPFTQPPQCVLPNRFKNNRIPKPLPNTITQSDLPSRRPSESQPEQTHTYTHKRTHTHTHTRSRTDFRANSHIIAQHGPAVPAEVTAALHCKPRSKQEAVFQAAQGGRSSGKHRAWTQASRRSGWCENRSRTAEDV